MVARVDKAQQARDQSREPETNMIEYVARVRIKEH